MRPFLYLYLFLSIPTIPWGKICDMPEFLELNARSQTAHAPPLPYTLPHLHTHTRYKEYFNFSHH